MLCHLCRKHLSRKSVKSWSYWFCPKCKGSLFPFSSLENLSEAKAILSFLKAKTKNLQYSKRHCPVCCKKMRLSFSGGGTSEIDVCDPCKLVWFDSAEFSDADRVRFGSVPPAPLPDAPPRRLGKFAQATEPVLDLEEIQVDHVFHFLTFLPREEKEPQVVARLLVLPLLLMSCVAFSALERNSISLGFFASDPWRLFGLTWLTSTFIHADIFHLLTNGYFIWLYGDNVEDALGPFHFLELFFLGSIGGHLAVLLWGNPAALYVGASGAVMALAVYYTLSFPKVRFSYFIPMTVWHVARIRVPILVVTLIYLGLDYLGAKNQIKGEGTISHLSHLGGAAVGALYWLLIERPKLRSSSNPNQIQKNQKK